MDAPPSPPRKARPWLLGLIVFVLAFDVAYFWQQRAGVYQSEFGGHPDEAAHAVTGLFVRDAFVEARRYALDGFSRSPLRVAKEFADEYYGHYPKIALGVWPPFFYLVQSAVTLPFGASRTTLLALMGALAAALGLLVFRALREEYGTFSAAIGATFLLSLPLVRSHYGMIMAETLCALLMFGAMLAFGNFLDRERRADALWFGVLAALAILTKGTGLALALAAPLALLFTRKFHVLKRPALWAAVLIVVIVAGPWTWATRHLGLGDWLQPELSWTFTREALPYYVGKFGLALGLAPSVLLALGVLVKMRGPTAHPGRWACTGALLAAIVLFQSLVPVGLEARHIIPALPSAVLFVIAGLSFVGDWVGRIASGKNPSRPWLGYGVKAVIWIGLMWTAWPGSRKQYSGFGPVAAEMLSEATPAEVTLVSSDATGEGVFIAEVALRERRPGHRIQPASKALARGTWNGGGYSPAFSNDDEALAFLTGGEIRYLVLDDALPPEKRRAHHDQLKRLVEQYAEHFEPIAEAELWRGGAMQTDPVKLYKISRKN